MGLAFPRKTTTTADSWCDGVLLRASRITMPEITARKLLWDFSLSYELI